MRGSAAPGPRLPISLYGRNSASGTYAYFKEHALLKGDYKDTVKEQPGSAAVVNGVAADRAGIGYSGIGYRTSEVRAIPLAKDDKAPLCEPTFANALRGAYPLGRTLYIYVAKKPGEPLPKLVEEFLRFVLAREGPGDRRQGRLWSAACQGHSTAAYPAEVIRRTTALVPHPDVEDRFQPKSLAA